MYYLPMSFALHQADSVSFVESLGPTFMLREKLKYHTDIGIQTLYSVLS